MGTTNCNVAPRLLSFISINFRVSITKDSYIKRQPMKLLAMTLGLSALLAAQIVETPVPGDPISIDSGKVAGKILESGVKAYFGMPFAAAPVGELRWKEPQPAKPWKGVYNADRKMPECIQVLRPHDI